MSTQEKKVSAFLADGYTEKGYVKAEPNMWPALRFEYRPMPQLRRALLQGQAVKRMSEDDAARKVAKEVADLLVSWDIEDANGRLVLISQENLLKIKPTLFEALTCIVMGVVPSDTDPEWNAAEASENLDARLESLREERPIGDIREARDEKNSEPGSD